MLQRAARMRDIELGLSVLLDGPNPALWDENTRRETLRFLRKCGKEILSQSEGRILNAILNGPPRDLYDENLSKIRWEELRDHEIRLRLYKLCESGATLPKDAQLVFEKIQKKYPWNSKNDHSEEFSFFMRSGWVDRQETIEVKDFLNMTAQEFLDWAGSQTGRLWDCGDGWYQFCESDPNSALKLLAGAAGLGIWPAPPWYAVLDRSNDKIKSTTRLERGLAEILAAMPKSSVAPISLQAARWLEVTRTRLRKRIRRKIWLQIWEASILNEEPDGPLDFDMTLNHPGGILGSVLYDELAEFIPNVSVGEQPGIPHQLRSQFGKIETEENPSASLARIRLAPMLVWLFRIDAHWTTRALLARMNSEDVDRFDKYLWYGYLWNPRCSDDLFEAIREIFFKVIIDPSCLNGQIRSNGIGLFISIAIPPERTIETSVAKDILYNLGPEGLADAAWQLRSFLMGAAERSIVLWKETIGPWFRAAWPRRPNDKTAIVAEKLAWMAIDSGEAFPVIVREIADLLVEEKHESALFHLLKSEEEKKLISRFPQASLQLTEKLVGDRRQYVHSLEEVLNAIVKAQPALGDEEAFAVLAARAQ